MSGEFLKAQTGVKDAESEGDKSGVMAGKVIRNCDRTKKGRVKVRLATCGGREIWARVVAPDTGVYFVPQVNDEVLVAFHQGDGNEAYVMGRLWNETKRPPRQGEDDPVTKRVILTPQELEVAFDDTEQSIVIKTKAGRHVTLKPNGIEIGMDDKGTATINLNSNGTLEIAATMSITLKAQTIKLDATTIHVGGASSQISIG